MSIGVVLLYNFMEKDDILRCSPMMAGWSRSLCFCLFLLLLCCCGHDSGIADQPRRVMTWVPPYAMSDCLERLEESYEGVGAKEGLTHIGLQFWVPAEGGKITLVSKFREKLDDDIVLRFRKWGEAHGVKILLCIYNGASMDWDWNLAKAAFGTHRSELIGALVAEVNRLGLDGVDIDFEGKGTWDEDRGLYVAFIKELADQLHAENKELTVDTFAYKWHAPNQKWWLELLPHIDGLHVMGYEETGVGGKDWRSYDFIQKAVSKHPSKLMIGMPSHVPQWLEKSAAAHIDWVAKHPPVGMAIWDAQLRDETWRSKEIWQKLKHLKEGTSTDQEIDRE